MKKSLCLLLLLTSGILLCQTKLVSTPLKLSKPSEYHQILNAKNNQAEVFTFACDKSSFHLLKFNSALFLTDSLHLKRPDQEYEILAGYSFSDSGNPSVYWSTDSFKKVIAIDYDIFKKTSRSISYDLGLKNQKVVSTFTEKNIFYIVSQSDSEDFMTLYCFQNGKILEKRLDFSGFEFTNSRNKPSKFHKILADYPIEIMDVEMFNPLFYSIQKSKLYIDDNKMFLTLDHKQNQTQLFVIDLETFAISSNLISQSSLESGDTESNSYYFQKHLYQLSVNENQIAVAIKQLPSDELRKEFKASKSDTIDFKNSPLFIQQGDQKPRELSSTKKFLRRLSNAAVGISVYETTNNLLVTVGRAKSVPNTADILMNVSLTVGSAMTGGIYVDNVLDESIQSIYFESLLDKRLEHVYGNPEPLAVDYISEFLNAHDEVRNESTFKYNDYFILAYYDPLTEQFVLRKFEDGFGY